MSKRDEINVVEVSNIIESFDVNEYSEIIKEQILNKPLDELYNNIMEDHFQPIYYNYRKISNLELDEETKDEVENKFFEICREFIRTIYKRFDIAIDEQWVSDNYSNIPALTIALYTFFVIDFTKNLLEVFISYIIKNSEKIAEQFQSLGIKKDVSTMTNKLNMSEGMSLIISNIYEITPWILEQLDGETYIEYLNTGYIPLQIIKELYESSKFYGNFMKIISEIYRVNVNLKSQICFDLICKIKNKEIRDLFNQENI